MGARDRQSGILPSTAMVGCARRPPVLRWLTEWLVPRRAAPALDAFAHAAALRERGAAANRDGRYIEAARLLLGASAAAPEDAEIRYELGCAMRGAGEPARAVTCFRDALRLNPRHVDAHVDLAAVLLGLAQPAAAEHAAREALRLAPSSLSALGNLGAALEAQGRFAEALDPYRRALEIDPACVPVLLNLGSTCVQLRRLDEAQDRLERAARLSPEALEPRLLLASVLLERGLAPRAVEALREAVVRHASSVSLQNSLGYALDVLGCGDEAMAHYERALALDPGDVQAHVNRSALLLLRGDYAAGWDEYEWRLRDPRHSPVHERFGLPFWDGGDPAGRRVLVYAEQGLGDEIMYASCIPDLLARGARCLVDCEPRLERLFRRSFPQAIVHGGAQTDPPDWLLSAGGADWKVPLASLARHLRRSADSFPRIPYLRADPARIEHWRGRLATVPGRKIGLSWRGGVPATGRGARSLPLAGLAPLFQIPGCSFVSLQYGECAGDLEAIRHGAGVQVHHWPEALADCDETAALLCALECTVSVCTALVHLGGALGCPMLVMAPLRPEPRYGGTGPRMPWYGSVQVFRQAAYGDWPPVVEAVAAGLCSGARGN